MLDDVPHGCIETARCIELDNNRFRSSFLGVFDTAFNVTDEHGIDGALNRQHADVRALRLHSCSHGKSQQHEYSQ
ncbi:hypothetical protein ES703_120279 [subsurface metagenome]